MVDHELLIIELVAVGFRILVLMRTEWISTIPGSEGVYCVGRSSSTNMVTHSVGLEVARACQEAAS